MDWKVGDKIKVIVVDGMEYSGDCIGRTGEILRIENDTFCQVSLDNGKDGLIDMRCLELTNN